MRQVKIKCPYCEYEYLLGEIYIPNELVGQPKRVSRDYLGKIIYNEGKEQDNKERYTCDKCKKTFNVVAKISTYTSKTT